MPRSRSLICSRRSAWARPASAAPERDLLVEGEIVLVDGVEQVDGLGDGVGHGFSSGAGGRSAVNDNQVSMEALPCNAQLPSAPSTGSCRASISRTWIRSVAAGEGRLRTTAESRSACRSRRRQRGGWGQVGQHHVEDPDRVRLGQRVVAVAALRGLDAGRAAGLAAALGDGVPGGAQPGRRRPRRPARRSPPRPDGRRRRRRSGASVSGCRAVDSPPMSHRSQVAISGSRPIAACSAACSAPGTSGRLHAGRRPATAGRAVNQTATVRSSRAGRSSGRVSITSPVAIRRRWYDTTWLVTSTSPRNSPTGPAST